MAVKVYVKNSPGKLSNNFTISEFSCQGKGCCSSVKIDSLLVTYLQQIRDHFKKPIVISSGYRCPTHNRNVGGVSNSNHTKGMAADIYIQGVESAEIAKYAESIGIKGIGLYGKNDGDFVHIDTRTKKDFWYGHAEEPRSTFGGSPVVKKDNEVYEFQKACIADGLGSLLPSGADGVWGSECEKAAKKYLKVGSTGARVKLAQKLLVKLGAKLEGENNGIDGKFGNSTAKAVKALQKKNNLGQDQIIGPDVWKVLCGLK